MGSGSIDRRRRDAARRSRWTIAHRRSTEDGLRRAAVPIVPPPAAVRRGLTKRLFASAACLIRHADQTQWTQRTQREANWSHLCVLRVLCVDSAQRIETAF